MMKKIVFLTGAGVSAESGIPTFRDADGLWHQFDVRKLASIEGWRENPQLMLDFYNDRRKASMSVAPNAAHKFIAALQQKYDVTVVTQNVDNLHEQAGSTRVIHLHGELSKVCSSAHKEKYVKPYPLDKPIALGDTAEDGSQLRPYIVWFGEPVPNLQLAAEAISEADIFVVVGTSLQVYPAAQLVTCSRARQNYVVDSNVPVQVEQLSADIKVIRETAASGMEKLYEMLMV